MKAHKNEYDDFLTAGNPSYLLEQYKRFLGNPHSVSESWRDVFVSLGDNLETLEQDCAGFNKPTRRRDKHHAHANMNDAELDCLTNDHFADSSQPRQRGRTNGDHARISTLDSIQAIMLIRAYRVRGHLIADLDPLKLAPKIDHPELDPANYGFLERDFDRTIYLNYVLGLETSTLREVLTILKNTYCDKIGVEFQQIQDPDQKLWLQRRIESPPGEHVLSAKIRRRSLKALMRADSFERFLSRKHIGAKRFGLEGAETIIPSFDHILRYGSRHGVKEVALGMAHRGRLNFIAHIFRKPYRAIFSEFRGNSPLPPGLNFSGDVKYHLGVSCDREYSGRDVHVSLTANPSHLEAVNTVVLGKVRAKQHLRNDTNREQVMGILIHGDAAFSGQGVVAETFLMSKLYGYRTGGTIHVIINNQIGFTTDPNHSRSSNYSSDIANVVGAPIFHVNGDDVDACLKVCEIAVEYRQAFKSDVVIDVMCYRRHGHNESDDPFFTQPKMYSAIAKHPSAVSIYRDKLLRDNTITEVELKDLEDTITNNLENEYEAADSYLPNKADWLEGEWKGFEHASLSDSSITTGCDIVHLKHIGNQISQVPESFYVNKKIARQLNANRDKIEAGTDIHWSLAEALAIGSIICDGDRVRLSGEDSKRGTFSQRHAVLTDQENENTFIPLNHIQPGQEKLEILDSPLSEYGVLGFEYGYATADPNTLVIWEAQFGDFANGAQVVIDQFICSGEVKWLRMNGLVLMLPHGYEGNGPEHSSARLERYLQLSAENNWQVCNLTSPANFFHVLRRQMQRNIRKPLVLMTPKSLLRHRLCVSDLAEMSQGTRFHTVLPDQAEGKNKLLPDKEIKRVVICCGKVYYDLLEARDAQLRHDVYLVRLEQLYPFPIKSLVRILSRFPNAAFVWCQEEPENMGAWTYLDRRLEQALIASKVNHTRPIPVTRPQAASSATGLARYHKEQQETLVMQALKISD